MLRAGLALYQKGRNKTMLEKRRLRFATIDGLMRDDLPLAAEVWLEDLRAQVWSTREVIKLATLFTRYMADPRPESLLLSRIERVCQIDSDQVMGSLRIMKIYGAIDAYICEDGALSASLRLSLLQRYRVLKIRKDFAALLAEPVDESLVPGRLDRDTWHPSRAASPLDPEPESASISETFRAEPPKVLAAV